MEPSEGKTFVIFKRQMLTSPWHFFAVVKAKTFSVKDEQRGTSAGMLPGRKAWASNAETPGSRSSSQHRVEKKQLTSSESANDWNPRRRCVGAPKEKNSSEREKRSRRSRIISLICASERAE